MTKKIISIEDYIVGKSQLELERVRGLLKDAQADEDYFREKAVAKLVAFHEIEVEMILHYVEMRTYYPDIATALEEQKPYLTTLWNIAYEEWIAP